MGGYKFETKAQLQRYVANTIEEEGLHYALVDYTSPESIGADKLDPELAAMWRQYEALCERICKHVGLKP